MNGILPDNEYTEVESKAYLNPQLQVDETNAFIDNLRQSQLENNAEIAAQTRALGTDVPSNLGGLIGGEGYFTSRYQTPQTNSLVQNLRTAAQAQALNQALANEQEMWKNRYQQAYRNYQSRQNAKANAALPPQSPNSVQGGYEQEDNSLDQLTAYDAGGYVTPEGLAEGASRMAASMNGYIYTQDTLPDGRVVISNTDDPAYVRASDGYFYKVPTSDDYGILQVGLSDSDRQNRANNLSQLEKIRLYYNQQRNN